MVSGCLSLFKASDIHENLGQKACEINECQIESVLNDNVNRFIRFNFADLFL